MAIFFFTQRSLLYYPNHSYVPLSEAHANKAFQEISVRTSDGLELRGWYAPATTKPLTIVFFHGNADYLYATAQIADPYVAAGYGVLLTEYRGYSGLPGSPTETGLYNDGRAYIRELIRRGVAQSHIIVFGHSLGTGVAVQIAQEFHVGGLMLLAPYLSVPKLARINFWFFRRRSLRWIALKTTQKSARSMYLCSSSTEMKIRLFHRHREAVCSPLQINPRSFIPCRVGAITMLLVNSLR